MSIAKRRSFYDQDQRTPFEIPKGKKQTVFGSQAARGTSTTARLPGKDEHPAKAAQDCGDL
eukprot:689724-Rhodomonas_salina.1